MNYADMSNSELVQAIRQRFQTEMAKEVYEALPTDYPGTILQIVDTVIEQNAHTATLVFLEEVRKHFVGY